MNPNIIQMIRLAKEYGCSINTTTNGTLLTPKMCDQLVNSGLDLIKISIDGATRETYQCIRGEDRFLHVLDGIRSLMEAKKRLGAVKPFVRLNYVMFKDNYHEIAKTVELVDNLGVDAIYFQPLDLGDIEERQKLLVGDLTYEEFLQEITQALHISQHANVSTNLDGIFRDLPTYWKKYQLETRQTDRRICILPWFSTFITVEGNLLPCCAFAQPNPNMGNILQADINEIWNGQKYQSFRKAIREGKRLYPMCKNCVPPTLGELAKSSKILPGFLK
jgi:radical SAM protein with 4Fe4S-binding SPASM domain